MSSCQVRGTGLSNSARLTHWLLTPVWEVGTVVSFILQMRRQTYGEANLPVVTQLIKGKSEFESGHAGSEVPEVWSGAG